MKKATLIAAALICAYFFAAGIAPAQAIATFVSGFSPNLADPQPETKATLTPDANRLIRWQGWLDVDAFSASVLEQMQKQLGRSIEVGTFTLAEPAIAKAVLDTKASDPTFVMNDKLSGKGENITDVKLYVWTYRHNYTDTGLYQLYVSAKAKVKVGTGYGPGGTTRIPHKDIQSLGYEFGRDGSSQHDDPRDFYADIEIWRGAVVRVDAKGAITIVGNEAGVTTLNNEGVAKAPISAWEKAPSLEGNENYKPTEATGAAYIAPADREVKIQKAAGDVQAEDRVKTKSSFQYRAR